MFRCTLADPLKSWQERTDGNVLETVKRYWNGRKTEQVQKRNFYGWHKKVKEAQDCQNKLIKVRLSGSWRGKEDSS